MLTLPLLSSKELEHYQRVRETFERTGQEKKGNSATSNATRPHGLPTTGQLPPSRPKFQTRTSSKAKGKSKGKGKATSWNTDDDDDGDGDDAYVTSNDFGTPARNGSFVDGNPGGAVYNGFQDPSNDDDDELYS